MTAVIAIVGCGYVGQRVASMELAAGRSVACLARTGQAAQALARRGCSVFTGDLDVPDSIRVPALRPDVLYYFAPPPNTGSGDPRLAALLERIPPESAPGRVVYISTSGVYGDCQGAWVTESRLPRPQSARAMRRWAAECLVRDFGAQRGSGVVILRVPGIYGPGRLPIERLRQGLPVVQRDESPFSNRIHVDDLAAVCVAAGHASAAEGIYNVSDGHPTTMTDYFFRVADVLGLARPPEISMAEAQRRLSPNMLSFLQESRRLDNRRMLSELGVDLEYSDLARGLAASIAG